MQTALEFLTKNLLDLYVQLTYGVLKVRVFLQHLKGLRIDLDILGVEGSGMAVFLEHSTALIDAWFLRSDPERQVAQMAVNLFAPLRDALADAIATHNLYAPSMATISVARNMLLERGAMIELAHRGIRLPRFPGLEERQHFNAHHRINRFRLLLPMTPTLGKVPIIPRDSTSSAGRKRSRPSTSRRTPRPYHLSSTVPSEVTPSAGRRLRVAVVPEQFPRDVDDFAGIFARDYVEAVRPHCDVVVVLVRADGQRPGVGRTRAEDGIEYVTCSPAIRDGGSRRQRLGRLEGLCRVGLTARLLQDVDLIHAHGAGLPRGPCRDARAPARTSRSSSPSTQAPLPSCSGDERRVF